MSKLAKSHGRSVLQVYSFDYVLTFPPLTECSHLTSSPPSVAPLCQRDAWCRLCVSSLQYLGGPSVGLVVVVFGCLSGGSLCRPYPPESFYFSCGDFRARFWCLRLGCWCVMFALQFCSVVFHIVPYCSVPVCSVPFCYGLFRSVPYCFVLFRIVHQS